MEHRTVDLWSADLLKGFLESLGSPSNARHVLLDFTQKPKASNLESLEEVSEVSSSDEPCF